MGRYLDIIRQVEEAHRQTGQDTEPAQGQSCTIGGYSLVPGDRVTWQGADGKACDPAMVDFVHTDHDGSRWAFCTLSDSWAAVNANFVTMIEKGGQRDGKTG